VALAQEHLPGLPFVRRPPTDDACTLRAGLLNSSAGIASNTVTSSVTIASFDAVCLCRRDRRRLGRIRFDHCMLEYGLCPVWGASGHVRCSAVCAQPDRACCHPARSTCELSAIRVWSRLLVQLRVLSVCPSVRLSASVRLSVVYEAHT
jgi:hypothetical protein